jgi:hypothetical protein
VEQKKNLIKLAVFDIDGCLSDDRHRLHLLPEKDGNTPHEAYDAYNELAPSDPPIPSGFLALQGLITRYRGCDFRVLFLTARPVKYRQQTEVWLGKEGVANLKEPIRAETWMRPNGDFQTSPDLKIDLLSSYIEKLIGEGNDVEVVAAYDDRIDVLSAYAAKGLTCYRSNVKSGVYCYHSGASPRIFREGDLMLTDIGRPVKPALNGHSKEDSMPAATASASPELAEIAGIFDQMSATLRSRSADYGYNASKVADMLAVMFPNGVTLKTAADFEMWHLFELNIVKLTRFVNSGLKHKDSIHDGSIYGGFVERLTEKHNIQIHKEPV